MSRIPRRRSPAKSPTLPCCKCSTHHPKDPVTGRMAAHTYLGHRCLGGDIPFARHREPPMGKLMGCIVSQIPMPNRARAIQLADGYIPASIIDRVASEPWQQDFHPLFWIDRMLLFKRIADDEAALTPLRRPRLKLVAGRARA